MRIQLEMACRSEQLPQQVPRTVSVRHEEGSTSTYDDRSTGMPCLLGDNGALWVWNCDGQEGTAPAALDLRAKL